MWKNCHRYKKISNLFYLLTTPSKAFAAQKLITEFPVWGDGPAPRQGGDGRTRRDHWLLRRGHSASAAFAVNKYLSGN